ncbi:glutaredoxin domain containing protein [Theileria equi strain WA]|uniref:Glutaredoxin domain containing protein n=1 Tax=Theileria equi strain WA TaxID=1537102 RepID=L1LF52_THEEQ|nr:glutaredoxin domain containing protein [Theileria equi strain WA]EKX73773.1 glutaredoxin domain containing protein [Theileria equi strain WA]|eukprot:XP_004833225.1 glutaredoxin domain containing protein [Theileria equi strain WA]
MCRSYCSGFSYFSRYTTERIFRRKQGICYSAYINILIFSPFISNRVVQCDCYDRSNLIKHQSSATQRTGLYIESCKWFKNCFLSKLAYTEENKTVESCCSTSEKECILTEAAEKKIKEEIKTYTVVLFMKGNAKQPQCKFSRQALEILKATKVQVIRTVNVLEDNELREGLKKYSNYPNFPQLYVRGKFVGGLQAISEMFEKGTLQELFRDNET